MSSQTKTSTWLSAALLLLSSTTIFASPLLSERATCASAMPGYVDPNAGTVGNEQLVCTVTTANYAQCSSSAPCSGTATYYEVAGGYTACGEILADTNMIVALSSDYVMGLLSSGTPKNPYCGATISVTYNGKTVSGIQVMDKCAGCKSVGHIDLSPGAFMALGASEDAGHVAIEWHFENFVLT